MIGPRPRRVGGVVRGELPDGEVVVSTAGGDRALVLNPLGDAVLGLCDGTRTVAEIAAFLCDALPVPDGADVERDVAALVDELTGAGVLEQS